MHHPGDLAQDPRYVLVAALPLEVSFPSQKFRLYVRSVEKGNGGGMIEVRLMAEIEGVRGEFRCAAAGTGAALYDDLYKVGIVVKRATVPATIFERLVAEGRAHRISGDGSA